ncbi:hypothetical protein ACFCP7_29060, partial [Paenibacillus elgii]
PPCALSSLSITLGLYLFSLRLSSTKVAPKDISSLAKLLVKTKDDSALRFVSLSSFQGTNLASLPFQRQEDYLSMSARLMQPSTFGKTAKLERHCAFQN